jgi:hypothetical protein
VVDVSLLARLSVATRRALLVAALPVALSANVSAFAETIGLVSTSFHLAGPFTADAKLECPQGLNPDNRDNYRAQFKTPEEQRETLVKFGSTQMHYRGPNGESDTYSPEAVHDLLPFNDGLGTVSDGLNLDGTHDGQATGKTCGHAKFTSPTGENVDNQLFRVFGCVKALRPQGLYDSFINMEIPQLVVNRWLIEITGVDDRVNDDHVDVTIAHGLDELVPDGNGGFVAGRTQRIDEGSASYIQHTTGRIVNGVLYTDPMPELRMTASGIIEVGERRFSDARFRLKLTPNGATGILSAYNDIQRLWRFHAKTLGVHGVAAMVSMPSIYASILRNADGHKDPATGQCTAISGVYTMDFVNANIVHQSSNTVVAKAASKGTSGALP